MKNSQKKIYSTVLLSLLFIPGIAFAIDTSSCVDTFKQIAKVDFEYRAYNCESKELFFGDEKVNSLSCTDRNKSQFSQPKKNDDGTFNQTVKTDDGILTLSYDEKGRPISMVFHDDHFKDDFFASTIELSHHNDKCIVEKLYSGTKENPSRSEFNTVACADWILYNENESDINQCLDDIKEVSSFYDKYFSGDLSKGSTFFNSKVNSIRSYISKLDENCNISESKFNAGESIKLIKSKLEKERDFIPEPNLHPSMKTGDGLNQ